MKQSFSFKGVNVITCFKLSIFTGYCVHLHYIGYSKYPITTSKLKARQIINEYHRGQYNESFNTW